MRKYVMIAVFAILTILAVGCGSQQGEESNALDDTDYRVFTENFRETYSKFTYVKEVAICKTEDFLDLRVIHKILYRYRKKEAEYYGRPDVKVEVILNKVEIVYSEGIEDGVKVIKPIYELQVTEKENNAIYEAIYGVDVYSGNIEWREGDAYWL